MKARQMMIRMRAILVIGTVCLALAPSIVSPSQITMAGSCAVRETWDGTTGTATNTGAASANITAQSPYYPCDASVSASYWEMVRGPGYGYAQGGWIIGDGQPQCTTSSPCVWSE